MMLKPEGTSVSGIFLNNSSSCKLAGEFTDSKMVNSLKYLKVDLECYDEVKHPNKRGWAAQGAGQHHHRAMEEQQTHWIFTEGLPSNHRAIQKGKPVSLLLSSLVGLNEAGMNECIFVYTMIDFRFPFQFSNKVTSRVEVQQ